MNFKDYAYFKILQESGVLGIGLEEFFQNIKNRTVVFFDTETTGFNPRLPYRQITQLAAIALDLESNTVLDKFAEVLSLNPATLDQIELEKQNPPSKGWSIEKVLDFSGYDSSKASKQPVDAGESFVSWVNGFSNPLLVAQNAQFDMNFMNNLMKHNKVKFQVLDFLKFNKYYLEPILLNLGRNGVDEAVKILSDLYDPKRNKHSFAQQKLGKAFGVDTAGAHVALHDVMQLVDLIKKVFDFINRNKQFLSDDIVNDYGRARKSWKTRKIRFKK
jgi:DNA polymerase III alpha subunit (gram-positive type)